MPRQIDWHQEDRAIESLDREGLSLEFLRRNHTYRQDFQVFRALPGRPQRKAAEIEIGRRWGLRFRA